MALPQTNTGETVVTDRQAAGPQPDTSPPTGTLGGNVPIGGIVMYAGLLADIPVNWQLCDGTGGTTDLSDRFIFGTTTEADIGLSGGTTQHKHSAGTLAGSSTSATDTAVTGAGIRVTAVGAVTGKTADAENGSGSTDPEDIYPPWVRLAFIQRIS